MHRQLGHFERIDSVALAIKDGGVDDYGETITSTRDREKIFGLTYKSPRQTLLYSVPLSIGHARP